MCGYVSAKVELSPSAKSQDTIVGGDSWALPFDVPNAARLNDKLVFAHYFPPYPISIDNVDPAQDYYAAEYLSVSGEGSTHSAYGGLLRDRPIPGVPLADSRWRQEDLESEVRSAIAAGIDGFSVDIMTSASDSSWWGSSIPSALMMAAHTVDTKFKIMLMPDMNGSFKSITPQDLAADMAAYANAPAVFKLDDGRIVVSPFHAEAMPAQWWTQFIEAMRDEYGIGVALVPLFLDATANMDAYSSISYGFSSWGNRSPASNSGSGPTSPMTEAATAHALGKLWMQSVSFQDARPSQSVFDEAENSQNLRDTWGIAVESDSEWVQLTTWNDYGEGTSFAPSVGHGRALLDLNAYWLYSFRTGRVPEVVRDTAYLIYRSQPLSAVPVNPSLTPMMLRPGSSPARDAVEVVTVLTEPATLTVITGEITTTCSVPAGVGSCLVPLAIGSVIATVTRGTADVARVVSHVDVSGMPINQNLEYLVDSSRR